MTSKEWVDLREAASLGNVSMRDARSIESFLNSKRDLKDHVRVSIVGDRILEQRKVQDPHVLHTARPLPQGEILEVQYDVTYPANVVGSFMHDPRNARTAVVPTSSNLTSAQCPGCKATIALREYEQLGYCPVCATIWPNVNTKVGVLS